MMTIDEIRAALKDRRLDMVSEGAGVHRSTVARVRDGRGNPGYDVIKRLSDYLTRVTE